ncbi:MULTISPECIES: sigma-E factor negative regulatory protein [unclassified Ectothiorhodospira]|uniref:sigma-E factor negative regulatory protein n=1 Tax=unclassified Ectothiorhodospira TaxID=2684909 RepID=UPI001EE7A395|nr:MULTISPECIES: sigma-E factor negative regulatory protein [unclassified Ectothiorhodospira]MCG5515267.1 sigma-E factor negative regulatory protein [Ectothiorhodospira sp. 9100]MCG5517884.1 sigma-E factor negative regulatory protein [Ectothiorhodospira sp. 9905]
MTATKEERLSALVDDEANAFELRRLVDEMEKHPEDRAQWGRYHLIGDVMRGNTLCAPAGFSERVMQAIEEEPAPAVSPWARHGWMLRPVAGMGMAAAVAVAVLVGVQNFTGDGSDPGAAEPAMASGESGMRSVQLGEGQASRYQSVFPSNARGTQVQHSPVEIGGQRALRIDMGDARFNSYLINHAESTVGAGAFPQTRNVGYGASGE